MKKCKTIETQEMLQCSNKHNNCPVIVILLDKDLEGAQRLVCQQCIVNNLGFINGISITQGLCRIQSIKEQIFDSISIHFQLAYDKLEAFQGQIQQVKRDFLQSINQITENLDLWMKQFVTLKEGYEQYSLLAEIDILNKPSDQLIELEKQKFKDKIKTITDQYWTKIFQNIQALERTSKDQKLLFQLNQLQDLNLNLETIQSVENVQNEQQQKESNQSTISQVDKQNRVQSQLIQEVNQEQQCHVLDFNNDNSLIAASCDKNIKIWKFRDGQMIDQNIVLTGHESDVFCILFSKKINWIVSGDKNNHIRSWIQKQGSFGATQWESSQPLTQHKSFILCLYLNQNEDELISGSGDQTIKVWRVNCQSNKIEFLYSLCKHNGYVDKVNLNSKETQMVSCGWDKQIILWEKDGSNKWQFKYILTQSIQDIGIRIGYLEDDTIVWCQLEKPFLHVFKSQNGKFQERSDLKVQLKEIIPENNFFDYNLFQLKYLSKEKVLIFKSNRYLYFMKQSLNSQLIYLCNPIDLQTIESYGNITNDGKYLVNWNKKCKQFLIYKFEYE
ncbi:unnamed protein product [Paramecium pentaurelia]|uniref:WD40-repeat-containing domain n=1 Tax=Paramecium pentaurelia TaxID=43138 RepID=A0A8S1YMP8_9CILI|nr:unnamed protein product [Paramecium pentaurelia]